MKRALDIALVVGLCFIYFVGLVELAGMFARIGMPWEPYLGKPAWEFHSLSSLTSLIQISVISVPVGLALALRFHGRSFRIAFLVSAPVALHLLWSLYSVSFVATPLGPWVVYILQFFYLLFLPPVFAWLFYRIISNQAFKPTFMKSHERGLT